MSAFEDAWLASHDAGLMRDDPDVDYQDAYEMAGLQHDTPLNTLAEHPYMLGVGLAMQENDDD